jgi:mRNA interferase MazF
MNKGDIILIPFPFSDLTSIKTRPALVLISGFYDVTVAFITSKTLKSGVNDLEIQANSGNGLKVDSIIKLDKIATIDKKLALGVLGQLSSIELKTVDQRMLLVFAINP